MPHAIPSIGMRYSFDTIDIKSICDKIKTLDRDFKMDLHVCKITAQMNVAKKKLLILIKKFNCLQLRFSQTIDVSNRGQLL